MSSTPSRFAETAIGIDPGDTTGYAIINRETGDIIDLQMLTMDQFLDRLDEDTTAQPVTLVVIEDFSLDGWRAVQQSGSRFQAVQIIGAVKALCRKKNIKLVIQNRKKRITGAQWSGIQEPKDHKVSHHIAALNHVLYYVMRYEGVPTAADKALNTARRSTVPPV